ncbi:MAG: hypothetical protein ACP5N1_00440 [Candidatus Woesearchaeota archaeon]
MTIKKYEMMAEYLIPRLNAYEQDFKLQISKVNDVGILPVLKQDNKRILLIDRIYTEKEYRTILHLAKEHNLECASVFFKDGKRYFRSAAFGEKAGTKGVKYKQTRELSLKDYTNEEIARMMLLSPPELVNLEKDNNILYYQPNSQRLEEELRKYRFTPIRFNYNHIPEVEEVYHPKNKNSQRIYINKLVQQLTNNILFDNKTLK